MAGRWIDLVEDDTFPRSAQDEATASWTAAPVNRVEATARRNEDSAKTVLEAVQSLRETAGTASGFVASVGDPSSTSVISPRTLAATSAVAPKAVRSKSFAGRLGTIARLLGQSSMRGSPAVAAQRVVAALADAHKVVANEEERFPASVRAVSSRTLNELRQIIDAGMREATASSAEVNRAIAAFEASHRAKTEPLRRDAEDTLRQLKERVLRSEAVLQLRMDVGEALKLSAADGAALDFEALPAHLDALSRTADPETVEREAECVLLSFRNFLASLNGGATADARAVPSELLDQISNEQRRRELSSLTREKAALLLEHTRRALAKAQGDEARRMRVVETILEIRARGDTTNPGPSSSSAALRHIHKRWSLRSSELRRMFERVAESAGIAARIVKQADGTKAGTVGRMRAALSATVTSISERLASAQKAKGARWRDEIIASFVQGESAVMKHTQMLAEAVTDSTELFVGTGLLVGREGHEAPDEEDEQDEDAPQVVPLSQWQTERSMQADKFVDASHPKGPTQPGPSHTGASQLLRKAHALTMEAFVAWVEYAQAVLLVNANGTNRALVAMDGTLQPLRRRFDQTIASCTNPLP
jgi:hypothetical protein